jgi:hypothetical protein
MFLGALASFYTFSSDTAQSILPLGGSHAARDAWGAFGAVLYTNIIIGFYVWSAFSEPAELKKHGGDDIDDEDSVAAQKDVRATRRRTKNN